MDYKSADDKLIKLIEKNCKEQYSSNVQYLMNLVPISSVFKKDETFRMDEVVLPAFKWIIGCVVNEEHIEYTIDSDLHQVYSIEADDIEVPIFKLETQDYKKLVKACEKRRMELLKQKHKKR